MSVTTYQTPDSITPAGNPQDFVALSNQIAVSDFMYRVYCTDMITAATELYHVKQRPINGYIEFPARNFSKKYVKNFVPNNAYGWQLCVDAIRKISVEIREFYSASEHSGSPPYLTEYIIWNGVLRTLDWVDYNQTDFVYTSIPSNLKYLTPLIDRITFDDKSLFLYSLTSGVNALGTIRIETYDENDNLLGQSDIANPYVASTTYTDKYLCLDIGLKGLNGLGALQVTGTFPVVPANTAYYKVIDVTILGSPPAFNITDLFRVDIECESKYDVYTIHFKAKSGNFETLNFSKLSEHTETIEKNYYRQNPKTLANNEYKYTKFTQWESGLSSTGTDTFVINTDWLTPAEVAIYREIVSSKEVYIDYGSTTGLVPVKVLDNAILDNKSFNKKLFAIALNIEITAKNNY